MLLHSQSKHFESKKLLYLCALGFLIAFCYATLRPLKASVFFQLVGKEYYPLSKFLMVILAIPLVAWYSRLVDNYKRHVPLYILFCLWSLFCLIYATLLSHPVWGIPNTTTSPYRILGWLFCITIDFYPTFIIGTLWSFINSISTHEFAKRGYGRIYASTKVGGLLATTSCMYLTYRSLNNASTIPLLITIAGLLTGISIVFIWLIANKIPEEELLGYSGKLTQNKEKKEVWGIFEGLKIMLTKPYVFGTFLLVYCYDVIFTIIEYQTHVLLSIKTANNANYMNLYLFSSATLAEFIGLFCAIFATSKILTSIKLKYALLIMPCIVGILAISLLIFPHLYMMLATITLLPAIHFSLNSPVREILFIPTIKEIQFKSKAWMNSFGRTFSKSSASTVNMLVSPNTAFFFAFTSTFSLALTAIWAVIAYALGKHHSKIIEEKSVVGDEK
jgi:AAA family ATP:ADP antiporter